MKNWRRGASIVIAIASPWLCATGDAAAQEAAPPPANAAAPSTAPTPASTSPTPASPPPTPVQVTVVQQPARTVQWGWWGPRVTTSGPPMIISDWHEGEPIPPDYRPVHRARTGAIVGGAIMFGVPYLLSLLASAADRDVSDATGTSTSTTALLLPAVGPFIQMTQTHSSTANLFLAIDGGLQCGGIALFLYGVLSPRTVLLRQTAGEPSLRFVPMVARNTQGVGVVGSF